MSDLCPKCGREKTGPSCPKCGLVFAKFDPAALEADASESLRALWEHTKTHWEKPEVHAVFIEKALAETGAGFAARCYRLEGDDPTAQKHLADIALRLEQTLLVAKAERPEKKPTARYALAFALLLLGATIAFLLMR